MYVYRQNYNPVVFKRQGEIHFQHLRLRQTNQYNSTDIYRRTDVVTQTLGNVNQTAWRTLFFHIKIAI